MASYIDEKLKKKTSKKMGAGLAKMCKHKWFRKFFLGMWDTMSHKTIGAGNGLCDFKMELKK